MTKKQLGIEDTENDIKKLYTMVTKLRRDYEKDRIHNDKLDGRIANLEVFAKKVAKKNSIALSFEAK